MSDLKVCKMCLTSWGEIEDVLTDTELTFNGYQAHPSEPQKGLLMFTHTKEGCGNTITIRVSNFKELSNGSMEFDPFTPGEVCDCKGYCLDPDDLRSCESIHCNGAGIRKLLQIIQKKMNPKKN